MEELHRINPPIILYSHYHNVLWEVRRMFNKKTSLIKKLESLYTISNEKPSILNQLQTLSEEELDRVVGSAFREDTILSIGLAANFTDTPF